MAMGLVVRLGAAHAQALPTGGHYVAGQGNIATQGSSMTINQSTLRGIVNWQGFSIGAGNAVHFNNGSGATLNRVTGAQLSQIEGLLSATGSLYLINPNGIVIGKNGQVVTGGGFVVSTRDEINDAFLAGVTQTLSGSSPGTVINEGKISAANGNAVLVGRAVTNSGSISAPNGTAALAAGNQIVLRPVSGPAGIYVAPGSSGDVTNQGTIAAASAALAAAGGNVYALAGGQGGTVEASGVKTINGQVWLTAPQGAVDVAGPVSAKNADGTGGQVVVAGQSVTIGSTANISAAGSRGGTVAIGAAQDTTPAGAIAEATQTTIATGARIAAGGPAGGGTIETSGRSFSLGAASINAGNGGSWVIDPTDLTVDAGAASTIATALGAGTNVTETTTADGTSGSGSTASGLGDINVDSAISWGSDATLTLTAYHSINVDAAITASGAGTLVLTTNNNLGGTSSGGALNFSNGNIEFTGNGGALTINDTSYTLIQNASELQAINNGLSGNYALAENISSGPSSFTPLGETTAFNGTFNGLGNTISNLSISVHRDQYVGMFGQIGSGGKIQNLQLANLVVGSGANQSYVGGLAGINNGAISNVHASGIVANSKNNALYLGGLIGKNRGAITDASAVIDVSGGANQGYVGGLIGQNNAALTNVYATGLVTNSKNNALYLGGLIGQNGRADDGDHGRDDNSSATISIAYATGAVSGGANQSYVGGLIGQNSAALTNVYATGSVTNSKNNALYLGGLIGQNGRTGDGDHGGDDNNSATISIAYATGAVSGGANQSYVGGLIGQNNAALTNVYARGSVSSAKSGSLGGLIGQNGSAGDGNHDGDDNSSATISIAYATGAVSGGAHGSAVGGLVGTNNGTISDSFWDTQATGQGRGIGAGNGNATGLTTAEFQSTSGFMAKAAGWNFSDTWAPSAAGLYPELYAVTPVVWLQAADATSTYGTATASGNVTMHGGPATYVFGPSGDTLAAATISTGLGAATNVGTYTFGNVTTAKSADNVTYSVIYSGTVTVNPALVTITAANASKLYGTNDPTLTYTASGLIGDPTAAGALSRAGYGTLAGENVGTYGVGLGTLSYGSNYTVALANNGAVLKITSTTLTVAANDATKTYGVADPTLTYATTGLVGGTTVDGVTLASDAAGGALARSGYGTLAGENVGTYDIGLGSLSYGSNYTVALANNDAALKITPATLTIAANGTTKAYGVADPTATYTASGLVGGTTVDGATLASDAAGGALARSGYGTLAGENAGTYDIGLGSLSYGSNYTVALANNGAVLTVSKASVTIAANNATKVAGTPDPTFTYVATGLAGGTTIDGVTLASDAAAGALSRRPGNGAGNYAITSGDLSYGSNYALTLADNGAALTITPAPIVNNIVIAPQLTQSNLQSAPASGGGVTLVSAGNVFAPLPAIISTISTSSGGGGQIIVTSGSLGSQGSAGGGFGGSPAFAPGSLGGNVIFENGNPSSPPNGNGGGVLQNSGGFGTTPTSALGSAPLGGNVNFENGNPPSPQNGNGGGASQNNGGSSSNNNGGNSSSDQLRF